MIDLFLLQKVYSFGSGKYGQLGQEASNADHVDPIILSALKGKRVVAVSCGEIHSAAITGNRSII